MPNKYKDEEDYVFSYPYISVFHQKFVLQKRIQSILGLGIFFAIYYTMHCITAYMTLLLDCEEKWFIY